MHVQGEGKGRAYTWKGRVRVERAHAPIVVNSLWVPGVVEKRGVATAMCAAEKLVVRLRARVVFVVPRTAVAVLAGGRVVLLLAECTTVHVLMLMLMYAILPCWKLGLGAAR